MTYLANQLPLSAHEGDAVLHGQVQSSLVGLLQREIKIKPVERDWGGSVSIIASPPPLQSVPCLASR